MSWIVGKEVCRSCDTEAVCVCPIDIIEPNNMQCYKCGHMTMELVGLYNTETGELFPLEDEEYGNNI